jgi:hypothetical protein
MEASHLTSYFDEAFFGFIFWQIFLWLHILMKVSLALYFDEGFFGFIFWWTLHTLTSSFNKGFIFSLKTKASHVTSYFDKAFFGFIFWWSFLWLRISTKVSLASYFDKGFFGFVFWWTLHTLTLYFNKGFIFCLKNEGCTNDFVFWWSFLCLRILMKLSLTSYFDEGLFGFVFWQSFLWLHILTKLFFHFVLWWRSLWLRIWTKASLHYNKNRNFRRPDGNKLFHQFWPNFHRSEADRS